MRIYSVVNHKGGVGKTTTTANVAAVLAETSRVLVVDFDPQAALTACFKVDVQPDRDIYTTLVSKRPVQKSIYCTPVKNLDIVPAVLELAKLELHLQRKIAFEQTLKVALKDLQQDYDFVFIDSPPQLGVLTFNSIIAAQRLIVPVQCEFLAMKGLADLENILQEIQISYDHITRKVLFTMYSKGTTHSQNVVDEVRRQFPSYENIITRTIKFAYSTVEGIPLVVANPDSEQAQQYRRFAEELRNEQ